MKLRLIAALIAGAMTLSACTSGVYKTIPLENGEIKDCGAVSFGTDESSLGEPYRVDEKSRCDLSNYAVAIRENGLNRVIYGEDQGSIPYDSHVIEGLINRARDYPSGKPLKILVFAHGGLVPHLGAMKDSEPLASAMLADGYEPVFLIWNSDFPLTYWDRLCCVRDGARETGANQNIAISSWLAWTRLIGDLGSGFARAPENFTKQTIRYVETSKLVNDPKYQLSHEPLESRLSERPFTPLTPASLMPAFALQPDTSALRNGGSCVYTLDPLKKGFCPQAVLPPFDDEAALNDVPNRAADWFVYQAALPARTIATTATSGGGQAWHNMVRRTRLGFLATSFKDRKGDGTRAEYALGGYGGFFQDLDHRIKSGEFGQRNVEVHLYGHSMGGFVINEVLARYPDLPVRNVVYLAAANSTREFDLASRRFTANPESLRKDGVQFFNLTLHPVAESREKLSGGVVPLGSLLEWIDEYFEGPRTFNDRTWGKWNNAIFAASELSPAVRDRLTLRVFPVSETSPAGCSKTPPTDDKSALKNAPAPVLCHPLKHGEFNDFTFWRASYVCDSASRNPACWARFLRSEKFCERVGVSGDTARLACVDAAKQALIQMDQTEYPQNSDTFITTALESPS